MGEYKRQNLVFEKEDLLIDSQGKYPGYNFYKVAGMDAGVKAAGSGEKEEEPVDIHSLLP
jgi:NADH-quinone oxidoreductase subunit I